MRAETGAGEPYEPSLEGAKSSRAGDEFPAIPTHEATTIRSVVAQASSALGAKAASIFLLSPDRRRLQGALVGWDWTRTSFVADIDDWPNVRRAIVTNATCHFTAVEAKRGEQGWFEQRGIATAVCAPMTANGRVLGVLFFDFDGATKHDLDIGMAKLAADYCAVLLEHARRPS
jgi:GAF domain-containing protein